MARWNTLRLAGAFIIVAAIASAVLIPLTRTQLSSTYAGIATDGAIALDCDASQSGIQSSCEYEAGATFDVQIHITEPNAAGYVAFQTKTTWDAGVINYLPAAIPGDEALWPHCIIPARAPEPPTGQPPLLFGCSPFPFPSSPFFDTGPMLQFTFQCKGAPGAFSPVPGLEPNQTRVSFIPRPGDPAGGTQLLDLGLAAIDPALNDTVITCSNGTPSPRTPTPVLPPNGIMAVDCDGSRPGVQSACEYEPGERFVVQLQVTQPPAVGYIAIQMVLTWDGGVANYLPAASAGSEALWPHCTIAARSPEPPTGRPPQAFGCAPFPFPTSPFFDTGPIVRFEFQCKPSPDAMSPGPELDPDQTSLRFIPPPGDPIGGTHFLDTSLGIVEPALLKPAVVTCREGPTPTPPTPPPPTVTPTPKPPPSTATPPPPPPKVDVTVDPRARNLVGFFGTVELPANFAVRVNVTFAEPLRSADYSVLLTPVGRSCQPRVVAKSSSGFSFTCPGSGSGQVDWVVLVERGGRS